MNVYMAASGGTCGGKLYPNLNVPLSHAPRGIVVRFWAFQPFFVSGGRFHWRHFNRVIAIAAKHHDLLLPVLANEHAYCDGPQKTLAWYRRGYRRSVGAGDTTTYRKYVATVVRRYAGNPTIAMWQLVNEAEAIHPDGSCDESTAFRALRGFSNDVGGLVHRLDPDHLVSLGAIAGYSGSGAQWCGAANADYGRLMATRGVDICDFHDYGYPDNPMGPPVAPNLPMAIQMCHASGKPIMVGETGIRSHRDSQLRSRSRKFARKFGTQFRAGVVGELMWDWAVKPAYTWPETDADYGIFPGDPSLKVLRHFGDGHETRRAHHKHR